MSSIPVLSWIALSIIGLALIHETSLRRVARKALDRLVERVGRKYKSHSHPRDGR